MDAHTYTRICLVRLSLCSPPPACLTSPHLEADPVIEAASAKQTNRFFLSIVISVRLARCPASRSKPINMFSSTHGCVCLTRINRLSILPALAQARAKNSLCKDAHAVSGCVIRRGRPDETDVCLRLIHRRRVMPNLQTRPFTRQRGRPEPPVLCHLPQRVSCRPRAMRGT